MLNALKLGLWIVLFLSTPGWGATDGSVIPNLLGGKLYGLGHGFDSATRTFRQRCIDASRYEYAGAQRADLQLSERLSTAELSSRINASIDAGVNAFVISGDVSVSVSSHIDSTETSETVVFSISEVGKELVMTAGQLNPLAQEAAVDPEFSAHACGDEYIERIRLGTQLFFTVHYDYGSKEVKNVITKKTTVQAFGFKRSKTSNDTTDALGEHVSVSVKATQIGGRPERLAAAIEALDQAACTVTTPAKCQALIDRLQLYISEPGGFNEQTAALVFNAEDLSSNTNILSYVTKRYHSGGFSDLYTQASPVLRSAEFDALDRMASDLEKVDEDRLRGERLLDRYRLKEPHRTNLMQLLSGPLRRDENILRRSIAGCYRAPLLCLNLADRYWAQKEPYNESLLTKSVSFFDYCLERVQGKPSANTVDALLGIAGTNDCSEAEAILEMKPSLDLHGRGLTVVEPLRGLFTLADLDLSNNAIDEVYALGELANLERLTLRKNALTDAGPISKLSGLRQLNISLNNLTDLQALTGMPNVKSLRAYGNPLLAQPAVDRSQFDLSLLSNEEACSYERSRLVRLHKLAPAFADEYAQMGFGPVYDRFDDPASAVAWFTCDSAVATYP